MKQSAVVVQVFTLTEVRAMLASLPVPHSSGIPPDAVLRAAWRNSNGDLVLEWMVEER